MCFHRVAPQVIRLSSQEMAGKVYSQCCCKVICISSDEFKYLGSSYFDGDNGNIERCTVKYRLSCLCLMRLNGAFEICTYLCMYVYIVCMYVCMYISSFNELRFLISVRYLNF